MAFWNVNCKKIGLEYLALLDATKDVDPNSKKARRSSTCLLVLRRVLNAAETAEAGTACDDVARPPACFNKCCAL